MGSNGRRRQKPWEAMRGGDRGHVKQWEEETEAMGSNEMRRQRPWEAMGGGDRGHGKQ